MTLTVRITQTYHLLNARLSPSKSDSYQKYLAIGGSWKTQKNDRKTSIVSQKICGQCSGKYTLRRHFFTGSGNSLRKVCVCPLGASMQDQAAKYGGERGLKIAFVGLDQTDKE